MEADKTSEADTNGSTMDIFMFTDSKAENSESDFHTRSANKGESNFNTGYIVNGLVTELAEDVILRNAKNEMMKNINSKKVELQSESSLKQI